MSAVSGGESRALAPGARPPLAVPRRLLRLRSDVALAERVAAGDETAFDVLYERHRPVVLAVCMGILGTAHDAEDATQETFSALAVALRSNVPTELRPWLIRVARNAAIDTTRRRKHRLLTLDGEIPEVAARPQAGKAEFEVVMEGIRELPEQQRTALLMRELGGHTYLEIAEFLETDEAAVRGLIARARVGLRSYREATELPCATARACIETEPDGRRYDKNTRRHLRTCASCRSYREALRGDVKALRAALPFQTGGAFGGGSGIAAGAMSAGKAALLGAGMSQVAATCAASVCAVGTVGGMVLIDPVHRLLGDNLLKPAVATAAHHHQHARHLIAAAGSGHVVVAPQPTYAPTTEVSKIVVPSHASGATRAGATDKRHGTPAHHRHFKLRAPSFGANTSATNPAGTAAPPPGATQPSTTVPPSTGAPSTGAPSTGAPSTGAPTTGAPSVGTTGAPSTGTPTGDPGRTTGTQPGQGSTGGTTNGGVTGGTTGSGGNTSSTGSSGSSGPTGDPGRTDPGRTDPGKTDPGKTDPGKTDPGKTDPGKTTTGTTGSGIKTGPTHDTGDGTHAGSAGSGQLTSGTKAGLGVVPPTTGTQKATTGPLSLGTSKGTSGTTKTTSSTGGAQKSAGTGTQRTSTGTQKTTGTPASGAPKTTGTPKPTGTPTSNTQKPPVTATSSTQKPPAGTGTGAQKTTNPTGTQKTTNPTGTGTGTQKTTNPTTAGTQKTTTTAVTASTQKAPVTATSGTQKTTVAVSSGTPKSTDPTVAGAGTQKTTGADTSGTPKSTSGTTTDQHPRPRSQ